MQSTNTQPRELRIAMLGMIPGNGHPFSWSAIVNGFNPDELANCPYPAIQSYLGSRDPEMVSIPGARVTHVWTDQPDEAQQVAAMSRIAHVVQHPEQVIGEVDAVIIATDDGTDHVRRARPFIEAGLPVFVDKPLATTIEELHQFVQWHKQGARILSSSGVRYSPELESLKSEPWLWLTGSTCKSWERYGIHILEPLSVLTGPGFDYVSAIYDHDCFTANVVHQTGTRMTLNAATHATGSFGVFHAYGKNSHKSIRCTDTYTAFRNQLVQVIDWFKTGNDPYPFQVTVELMAVLIAAIRSSEQQGKQVSIQSVLKESGI